MKDSVFQHHNLRSSNPASNSVESFTSISGLSRFYTNISRVFSHKLYTQCLCNVLRWRSIPIIARYLCTYIHTSCWSPAVLKHQILECTPWNNLCKSKLIHVDAWFWSRNLRSFNIWFVKESNSSIRFENDLMIREMISSWHTAYCKTSVISTLYRLKRLHELVKCVTKFNKHGTRTERHNGFNFF